MARGCWFFQRRKVFYPAKMPARNKSAVKHYSDFGNFNIQKIYEQNRQTRNINTDRSQSHPKCVFFWYTVTVAGPKGTLSKVFKDDITIAITDPAKDGAGKAVNLNIKRNDKFSKSLWGTYASHIKNMIAGVETPYQKKLILEGVGFKSDVKGK